MGQNCKVFDKNDFLLTVKGLLLRMYPQSLCDCGIQGSKYLSYSQQGTKMNSFENLEVLISLFKHVKFNEESPRLILGH